MKNFCFLYNPSTNRRRSLQKFQQLKSITGDWEDVAYKTSDNSKHLKKIAREASESFDVVVACGGDGTVRDVAVSIIHTPAKLGVIPLGSGNDFSKTIGLPSNLIESLNVLYRREIKAVDLGKYNDFHFINTLGFGFDGETNLYAGQSPIRNGPLRYAVAALKTNFRRRPFETEVIVNETRVARRMWIMVTVANGRVEGGNFVVAPEASPFDGALNLLTVQPVSKWILPFLLPLFIIGKQGWLPYIKYYKAKKLSLKFQKPVFIHSDGEQIRTPETVFNIEILPSALQVIC